MTNIRVLHPQRKKTIETIRSYLNNKPKPNIFVDLVRNYIRCSFSYKYHWWSLYIVSKQSKLLNVIEIGLKDIESTIKRDEIAEKLVKAERKIKAHDQDLKDKLEQKETENKTAVKKLIEDHTEAVQKLMKTIDDKESTITVQAGVLDELLSTQDEPVKKLISALERNVVKLTSEVSTLLAENKELKEQRSSSKMDTSKDVVVDIPVSTPS